MELHYPHIQYPPTFYKWAGDAMGAIPKLTVLIVGISSVNVFCCGEVEHQFAGPLINGPVKPLLPFNFFLFFGWTLPMSGLCQNCI